MWQSQGFNPGLFYSISSYHNTMLPVATIKEAIIIVKARNEFWRKSVAVRLKSWHRFDLNLGC